MTMSDLGIHPDLLEEVIAEREAQQETSEAQNERGGRRTRAARRSTPPSPATPPEQAGGPEDGGAVGMSPPSEGSPQQGDDSEPPEWFGQVREATSPAEAFRLLAQNLPAEQLAKDERLSGLIGQQADRLARERDTARQRDAIERQKREAAANNDLYTLGELTQRDYTAQIQAIQAQQQAAPFMASVENFQRALPDAVQQRVSGQQFQSVEHYLQVLTEEAVKLGVEAEMRRRESALRKSVLSEMNGDEPVPERENGTPSRVREVTDEQIANMSLAEYDALFDDNGRPRQGVRHRSTRGIPIRKQ